MLLIFLVSYKALMDFGDPMYQPQVFQPIFKFIQQNFF